MADGDELSFARVSEQRPGQIPGDVKVSLRMINHDHFKRKGRDLHTTLHISLREALLGFSREIRHLDGHIVTIERLKAITVPGQQLRVVGEGMPSLAAEGEEESERPAGAHAEASAGSLYVKFVVDFPEVLSEQAAEWASKALPQ
mmetsp:Transcript_26062/g.52256  ORF Transcript_26062/g.52256 Transcript_26062/m.52256 type:complete len:145 (-) Transcript_26062:129-563(-)